MSKRDPITPNTAILRPVMRNRKFWTLLHLQIQGWETPGFFLICTACSYRASCKTPMLAQILAFDAGVGPAAKLSMAVRICQLTASANQRQNHWIWAEQRVLQLALSSWLFHYAFLRAVDNTRDPVLKGFFSEVNQKTRLQIQQF